MSIVYELPAILLRAGEEYRRLLREAEENLQKRGSSSLSDPASENAGGYFEAAMPAPERLNKRSNGAGEERTRSSKDWRSGKKAIDVLIF